MLKTYVLFIATLLFSMVLQFLLRLSVLWLRIPQPLNLSQKSCRHWLTCTLRGYVVCLGVSCHSPSVPKRLVTKLALEEGHVRNRLLLLLSAHTPSTKQRPLFHHAGPTSAVIYFFVLSVPAACLFP
jgi:hypothetical protein